jgi:hypothetical protein
MLSPAAYRLAYWEASVVRCAPVMREPLANALATAPPFVVGHRGWTTTFARPNDRDLKINDQPFLACFRRVWGFSD